MVAPIWGAPATPDALGGLVATLRRQRDLTQGQLAESAGVPRRFVNELEGGHATIYLRRLFDVLDALGARLVVEEPGVRRIYEAQGHGTIEFHATAEGEATSAAPGTLKDLGW